VTYNASSGTSTLLNACLLQCSNIIRMQFFTEADVAVVSSHFFVLDGTNFISQVQKLFLSLRSDCKNASQISSQLTATLLLSLHSTSFHFKMIFSRPYYLVRSRYCYTVASVSLSSVCLSSSVQFVSGPCT